MGSARGSGPFWLAPGTYTLTLPYPFVGIALTNITIEIGKVNTVDPTKGLGKLTFRVPKGISLNDTKIMDKRSGSSLGLVYGLGPFWLAPGTYTVEPGPPILGVRRTDVIIEAEGETVIDFR